MMCPECKAVTLVLWTKAQTRGVIRRRECFNGHRFSTIERVTKDLKQGGDRRSDAFKAQGQA